MILKVYNIIDGDTLNVINCQSNEVNTVRLLGIDAPETRRTNKLKQDERETHLPGQFLIKLGKISFQYLLQLVPPGTKITMKQEQQNTNDVYGRILAYVFLSNGKTLNEIMIKEGYAKAYNKYRCDELLKYQILNFEAKNGWALEKDIELFGTWYITSMKVHDKPLDFERGKSMQCFTVNRSLTEYD